MQHEHFGHLSPYCHLYGFNLDKDKNNVNKNNMFAILLVTLFVTLFAIYSYTLVANELQAGLGSRLTVVRF